MQTNADERRRTQTNANECKRRAVGDERGARSQPVGGEGGGSVAVVHLDTIRTQGLSMLPVPPLSSARSSQSHAHVRRDPPPSMTTPTRAASQPPLDAVAGPRTCSTCTGDNTRPPALALAPSTQPAWPSESRCRRQPVQRCGPRPHTHTTSMPMSVAQDEPLTTRLSSLDSRRESR